MPHAAGGGGAALQLVQCQSRAGPIASSGRVDACLQCPVWFGRNASSCTTRHPTRCAPWRLSPEGYLGASRETPPTTTTLHPPQNPSSVLQFFISCVSHIMCCVPYGMQPAALPLASHHCMHQRRPAVRRCHPPSLRFLPPYACCAAAVRLLCGCCTDVRPGLEQADDRRLPGGLDHPVRPGAVPSRLRRGRGCMWGVLGGVRAGGSRWQPRCAPAYVHALVRCGWSPAGAAAAACFVGVCVLRAT